MKVMGLHQTITLRYAIVALPLMATAPARAQAAGEDAERLGDIVVTAQKRPENLHDIPIAITAIPAERLDRQAVTNTADLARYVPGLLIGKSLFAGQTYFRGIGQGLTIPGGEAPIATYIDGVYLASPSLAVFDLNNVEQVAVLKGPQSTLFGRNATGGVIQVTTRAPSDRPAARVELGYGRFATLTGKALISGPILPDLAASLAFTGKRRGQGPVFNRFTGRHLFDEKSWSLQNRWVWTPGALTADLNLIHGDYRNMPGSAAGIFPGHLAADGATRYLGYRTISNRVDGANATRSTIASLKTSYALDGATISNQIAYTHFRGSTVIDQSGTAGRPNPNNMPAFLPDATGTTGTWTDELQIQTRADAPLQWTGGLFYLHNRSVGRAVNRFDESVFSSYRIRLETDSLSAFGQVAAAIAERTRLTLGLRYTSDRRRISGVTVPATPPNPAIPTAKTWSRPTWRVAIDHRFTPDIMAYASYVRGFRSGSFTTTALSIPPADPETVDAYEAGLKAQLWDRRLRVNLTGFVYDYRDIQLRALRGTIVDVFNAARARIHGGEAEIEAALGGGLRLSGGLQLLDARYRDFPNGVANVPSPLAVIPTGCVGPRSAVNGGTARLACDLSGNRMVKAPTLSANVAIDYERQFAWGSIALSVQDSYSRGYYFEPDNILRQPAYHWVDASIRWRSTDQRWTATLWGTNLAKERVYDSALTGAGSYIYRPGSPVGYGVTLGLALF
jgi:iron complex outermembrane recepter protein